MIPSPLEMIRRLVSIRTVSSIDPAVDSSNAPAIEEIAGWARALGATTEVLDVPGSPSKKVNLVATFGEGRAGDGLVLAGHSDTVPFDESGWRTDPFDATERDGRLFGLGTADMKGFFACALHAVARLEPRSFRAPLTLVATSDEECTMAGAKLLRDRGRALGRAVVIGEPTSLAPIRMHKGVLMERVVLHGRGGHSSNPARGASAIDAMRDVLVMITAFRAELARHKNPEFEVAEPTLNFGMIQAGDAPNRIASRAELRFDLRVLPGMDHEVVRAELRTKVAEVAARHGVTAECDDMTSAGAPPFETPANAELVALATELTGLPPAAVAFGTEAPYYRAMGMEAIVLGAGSITTAHQPNEFLPLEEIPRAIDLYEKLARRYCEA
jgi:acetylornithine deacetylase